MPRNFLKIHSPVSLRCIIMATQDFKTFSALFGSKSNQVALKEEELVKTEGDCEMGGDAKKLLEESKMLLKEAEKKEEEVRKVVKQNIHADTADKIEERLDEVKAMIGKVTSKSGEVKEWVQTGKPAGMSEGKIEVLVSKDMNVAEAEVPESKKRYLSKLGIQQEVAKPKVTEDVKKPEVQVMKMPAVIVKEADKTPEANKVNDVKEAVKKPEVTKAVERPEIKEEVKKTGIKEEVKKSVGKPEVKEAKKPEVTEAVIKPDVTEAVIKP